MPESPSQFVYSIYIRTTPEKLWQTLLSPEFQRQFWAETWQESEWKVGAAWRIMLPDGRVADTGEILEFDPYQRIVLTWRNEFKPELKNEGFSRMTYELVQQGDAVKLTVIHQMDKPGTKFIDAVSQGWPPILSSLKSLLETGEALEMTRKWPKNA
jgi:uncharacterized protein YndB with AHSA1/START domain